MYLDLQLVLGVAFATLPSTVTNLRAESAISGEVAWAEVFIDPISRPIVPATPRMWQDEVTLVAVDGLGVGLHEAAAEAARVRFSNDGKEPPRGRLYAAQELVRAMCTAAVFIVAATSAHRCLHQNGSNERCTAVRLARRVRCVVQLRREEGSPLSPWRAVLAEVGTRPRGVRR